MAQVDKPEENRLRSLETDLLIYKQLIYYRGSTADLWGVLIGYQCGKKLDVAPCLILWKCVQPFTTPWTI